MKPRSALFAAASVSVYLGMGCSVPPKGGFEEVSKVVAERISKRVHWYQGTPEDAEVADAVRELLADELTADEAVQVALLNNRSLQAVYEELGIAQAELVQAGLLRNPIFSGHAGFPRQSPARAELDLEVGLDFLNILLVPSRKKLARIEFERTKARVAQEVLRLAADVRSAYYHAQGARQVGSMLAIIAEAAESAAEIAKRQYEAGNINELEYASRQGAYEKAKLDLAESELEVRLEREELTRLMGLGGHEIDYKISERLPEVPETDPGLEQVEAQAIAERLDLRAARKVVERAAEELAVARTWRWFGAAEVATAFERESEEDGIRRHLGPTLVLELPIFDQRQAKIAALEAALRRGQREIEALTVEIRSEVRATRERLLLARRTAEHYRQVLIPLREKIVALTQQHYNFMLMGIYQLLEAKQEEVNAYREYIEAVQDYWVIRSKLALAVGGRLEP